MKPIRVFEMFAGYGGASFGFKKANIPYECVGISEIDKGAIQCYNQNFPNIKNYGDCTKIEPKDLPDFDLLTGGFPCQDVSLAGDRDLSKGRTNLYKEILRIAKAKKPKYLLLENVKGLLSMEIDEVKLVNQIVRDLKAIGYGVCWKVLNSKEYGIPQNRERIWFVCKLGGWDFMEFQFPNKIPLKIFLKDILEKEIDKKYYLSDKMIKAIIKRSELDVPQPNLIKGEGNEVGCAITTKAGGRYQDNFVITCDINGNPIPNVPEIGEANRVYLDEGISPTIKGSINIKTRDVQVALDNAQKIANEEQKLVQLDVMHLKFGEIRPLSTYIPQDLDVHRCLQSGEPKEVLIEPYSVAIRNKNRSKHQNRLGKKYGDYEKDYQFETQKDISYTIKSSTQEFMVGNSKTIRKLTPKECFRLMGFLNDEINIEDLSDTQRYKLAGNGWDVNVVSKILKELYNGQGN